ncbi:MAG: AI-2E family transporter [Armatimonadota bacterium]|nr:AI-2E family transporter [bacterium]
MAQQERNNEPIRPRSSSVGQNVLTFLAILGILLFFWLIVKLKSLVVLLIICVVFATGLAPAVARLERIRLPRGRRFPRILAIIIIYILAIIVALGLAALIVVPVVGESIKFANHLPEYIASVKSWLADIHQHYPRVPDYAGLVDRGRSQIDKAGEYVLGSAPALLGFFGSIIGLISVAVITLYLLSSYETIKASFLSLMPPKHVEKTDRTLSLMAAAMGGWLRGQLTLALIIGVVTSAGMWLIGIPYPFVIGVVGAVGECVPMVGPVAAAIPAVLLALFGPLWKLIPIVIFFTILTQVENNILAPKIMQRHVGLNPLITILALLAGAALLGIVGALLAIPVAAALQVLIKEIVLPAIRNGNGGERKDT